MHHGKCSLNYNPLIILLKMPPLPCLWYVVIKCGLKHFVSMIGFGRSSNHRMCFWLPVCHSHSGNYISWTSWLTNHHVERFISERKCLSSSLRWETNSNYWYHSPRKHCRGMEHSMWHKWCRVSMCNAAKEAIWVSSFKWCNAIHSLE